MNTQTPRRANCPSVPKTRTLGGVQDTRQAIPSSKSSDAPPAGDSTHPTTAAPTPKGQASGGIDVDARPGGGGAGSKPGGGSGTGPGGGAGTSPQPSHPPSNPPPTKYVPVLLDKGRNRNPRCGKGGGGTWGPGGRYNPDGYGCLLGLPLSPLWALAGFARGMWGGGRHE